MLYIVLRSFVGDEPFAVMLGDDIVDNDVPCLKQLMDCYDEYKTTILGVQDSCTMKM